MRSVCLAVLLLGACGQTSTDQDPIPEPPPEDDVDPGHGPVSDPPPGTLVRLTGTVTVGGAEARPGMDLEAEVPIVVPIEGRAVIQLRDEGRVELDGPARAILVEDGSAQMLLIRGSLFAVQPPGTSSPRPPLRIGSPSMTVEIGVAGELYLAAFENGVGWLAVLGGGVAVTVGDADNRHRLRTLDLTAGAAVAVPDRLAEPTEGPRRLSAAREAAAALAAGSTFVFDAAAEQAALGADTTRLDQALRWLETETRRGRELTNQHRDFVREANTEESTRIQRELVGHSQELYRLRRLATARWERVRSKQLRLVMLNGASREDPVALRRDRVAGLLGH